VECLVLLALKSRQYICIQWKHMVLVASSQNLNLTLSSPSHHRALSTPLKMSTSPQRQSSEKTPLLPRHETPEPEPQPQIANHDRWPTRPETALILISVVLMAVFVTMLYLPCIFGLQSQYSLASRFLAVGLHTSTKASLPAPILFFLFTPWLVRQERVAFTRYLTLVAYLAQAIIGAGIIGWDLREALSP
jgi:hypothetical protein